MKRERRRGGVERVRLGCHPFVPAGVPRRKRDNACLLQQLRETRLPAQEAPSRHMSQRAQPLPPSAAADAAAALVEGEAVAAATSEARASERAALLASLDAQLQQSLAASCAAEVAAVAAAVPCAAEAPLEAAVAAVHVRTCAMLCASAATRRQAVGRARR